MDITRFFGNRAARVNWLQILKFFTYYRQLNYLRCGARLLASDDEAKIEKALRERVKIEWEKSLVEEPSKNGK